MGAIDWSSIRLPTGGGPSVPKPQPPPQQQRGDSEDPEAIRQTFLNDPHQMSLLKERNPKLADVINSQPDFAKVCMSLVV